MAANQKQKIASPHLFQKMTQLETKRRKAPVDPKEEALRKKEEEKKVAVSVSFTRSNCYPGGEEGAQARGQKGASRGACQARSCGEPEEAEESSE
jgi:hypothetical protein